MRGEIAPRLTLRSRIHLVHFRQGFISILPPEYKSRPAFPVRATAERSRWMVCGVSQTRGMEHLGEAPESPYRPPCGCIPDPIRLSLAGH